MDTACAMKSNLNEQMGIVTQLIMGCTRDVENLSKLHVEILSTSKVGENKDAESKLAEIIGKMSMQMKNILEKLKGFESMIPKMGENHDLMEDYKHRYDAILTAFMEVIKTYKTVQIIFLDECVIRLHAHLRLDPEFEEVEIDKMLQDGNFADVLHELGGNCDTEWQQTWLADAEYRYWNISKLKDSINEINSLMVDYNFACGDEKQKPQGFTPTPLMAH